MPAITVDGKKIECRDGIPVLQAVLEAGGDVPHYCYHPGLSIVASCRLCLMEMKLPNPQTREPEWVPKLFPSCQTPVKDGMEVRFDSDRVRGNQQHCMEYFLLNHPLDCPVCDKAGECCLQDYSEKFGHASSRMVEDKHKNPKKDIGPRTLLYQDRCVMCTRCVRFAQEIAGTGELTVVNRGNRAEIDVFPGVPLANPLQGNVVDLCPVGCLLDKDFLFKQRVWFLNSTPSVCPGCSRGCTIRIDQNENRVHRLKPRFNEKVNAWWVCDEGRFGWKYVHAADRLRRPLIRRGEQREGIRWEEIPATLQYQLEAHAAADRGAACACVLSPMMSCEEAWLLAKFVRRLAPSAALVPGPAPRVGDDQTFASGFRISAEKCPNRRGVERVIAGLGGTRWSWDELLANATAGSVKFAYVTGGYPSALFTKETATALGKAAFLAVHDLFASPLSDVAELLLPGAAWAERDGAFMNDDGLLQPFERAIPPLEGVKRDGQVFFELFGQRGLYRAADVRALMAAEMPEFSQVYAPRELPEHAH
ncbi:MAG: Nitrate reductase [Phycisphaerae bacterium]|nr:Nitrate reductase [Phycisphaerae bacterium]